MAYISFRSSDNSKTEAQLTKQNMILGRVLLHTEVDANFKALNDELSDTKFKYGLGASLEDGITVAKVESTDDLDNLAQSGFYTAETSTKNVPTDKNGTPLLNVQSTVNFGADKATAFQLGTFDNRLYQRIRFGKTTWNDWDMIATQTDLDENIANINFALESVVDLNGGRTKGEVYFQNDNVIVGTGNEVPETSLGITFNGANYITLGENEKGEVVEVVNTPVMGSISYDYSNSETVSYSAINLKVVNPLVSDKFTSLQVGWKLVDGIFVPYAYAPQPYSDNDPDSIATVGWVNRLLESQDYVSRSKGGAFEGQVFFREPIFADKDILCDGMLEATTIYSGDIVVSPLYCVAGGDKILGSAPSETLESSFTFTNNLLEVEDVELENIVDGGLYHTLDKNSNSSVEMRVKNWVDNNRKEAKIAITVDKNGVSKTYSPHPTSNSNDNQIATTKWVIDNVTEIDMGTLDGY